MRELIGISILAWMLAEGFEPIQHVKHKLGIHDASEWFTQSKLMFWLVKLINCSLCCGFWLGLALTKDIYSAAITSVCAEAVSRLNKHTMML